MHAAAAPVEAGEPVGAVEAGAATAAAEPAEEHAPQPTAEDIYNCLSWIGAHVASGNLEVVESEVERAVTTLGWSRARVVSEAALTHGDGAASALVMCCYTREGGGGPRGWAGVVAFILSAVSNAEPHQIAEWLNSDSPDNAWFLKGTPLLAVVMGTGHGDRPKLAVVVALLAYGADPTFIGVVRRPPRRCKTALGRSHTAATGWYDAAWQVYEGSASRQVHRGAPRLGGGDRWAGSSAAHAREE